MRPGSAVRACTASAREAQRQAGYTLIESLFVIGIFSLIVIGMLSIYTSVVRQKNVMLAAADISAIRSALPRANCTSMDDGIHWTDLAKDLPLRLRRAAEGNADNTLDSGNPWAGAYVLTNQADSRIWVLQVRGIPENLRGLLSRQVEAVISDVDLSPGGCPAGSYCLGFEIEVDLESC